LIGNGFCNDEFNNADCYYDGGDCSSYVMIASGNPYSSARKTEILGVANGLTCSDLAEFPVELSGPVGANLGGTPVLCGGYLGSEKVRSEKCFRFKNSVWAEFASMKEKRDVAAAVMHNGKLHVFGGYSGYSNLQTTETINVDGEVSYGPDLPSAVDSHAMTKINDTVSILSGGWTDTDSTSGKTWYYNHDTETFTSGPDLLQGRRYSHGSAINVDKVTKSKIVVVTGGYNGNNMDSTELLINGQWQTGPPLPKAIEGFSMLEMHGDTYVIGGYGGGYNSAIYQLSCSSGLCSWTTLNQQLKVGRRYLVAIAVQDNLCN